MAMTGGTAKLVHTGYGNGNTSWPIRLYVYYKISQSSQNIADNSSTVTVGMYIDAGCTIGAWPDNGSYVGTTSLKFDKDIPANTKGVLWLAENKSFTVKHSEDGTGEATIYWKWGVNSSWGGCVLPSGSFKITLPTIARLSVPTCAASAKMGSSVTIYTNRKSTALKHVLMYTFGSTTKETQFATGVGDSYTWPVPDLAAKCNNALSGTCTIYCHTYSGSTYLGTKTTTLTLTVPDASVPTLSASTITMGNSLTIYTNRKSSNFTHKIEYEFHGKKGTPSSAATTSCNLPVTIDGFAGYIPSETKGTGTITCTTYNGTAPVGTAKTVTFTATVPDNSTTKPTISGLTLTPSHPEAYPNLSSHFADIYVQGLTKVKATYSANAPYSSVKSVTVAVKNSFGESLSSVSGTSSAATSGAINAVGDVTVTVTVTNARGQTNSSTKTVSFYAYSKPELLLYGTNGKDSLLRCNDGGEVTASGLYLKICAGRKEWSPLNGKNHCDLQYRWKVFDGLPLKDEEWITLLDSSDTENEFSGVATVDGNPSSAKVELAANKSYLIEIRVVDTVGNYSTFTKVVLTCEVTFLLKNEGKGASFGKYPEADDLLDVAWNGRFMKDLQVLGNLTAGHIGGIGTYDGKDFDELVYNTGYYVSASAPEAVGCSNYPIDKTGVLEVISNMYQDQDTLVLWGFAFQTYRTYDGEFYTRSYYSGKEPNGKEPKWSNWIKHSGVVVV